MKPKEVGAPLGAVFISLMALFISIDVMRHEKELSDELDQMKRSMQESHPLAPEISQSGAWVMINQMDPDPKTGSNRYKILTGNITKDGQVFNDLISGTVWVSSQVHNEHWEKGAINICSFKVNINRDKAVIEQASSDCVKSVIKEKAGTYIVTEKSWKRSAAVASLGLDAKWGDVR